MISLARDGCLCVLDAPEAAGVKRVVMTSSSAASMPPLSQLTGTVTESMWSNPEAPLSDRREGGLSLSALLLARFRQAGPRRCESG